MRALFFAYYFPPMGGMGSIRALGLARHLPAADVDVTVVAPRRGTFGLDPSLALPATLRIVRTGTAEPAMLLRRSREAAAGGTAPAHHGAGPRGLLRALVWRLLHIPDPNVGWVPAALRAGLSEARRCRPDVVLSSSPPLSAHLAAARCADRLRVPFVADFRDPFDEQRLFSRGLRRAIDERLEGLVLRRARGLVATSHHIVESLHQRSRAPALLLRNGYDEDDFADPPPAVTDDAFRFVHVGTTYSERRDLRPFFSAVRDLAAEGASVRVRFVGATDPGVAAAAREVGADELCEYRGFVSHEDAIREMRAASALLYVSWTPQGAPDPGSFAGRTLENLRAGRPLLVVGSEETDCNDFIRARGGAAFVGSEDPGEIRGVLQSFLEGRAPRPVDPNDLRPWSRGAQARLLADWLRSLL
jgi:hypothetical protein